MPEPLAAGPGGRAGSARNATLVAIGGRIRKLREERGIAQEEFAARAGMDRSYYGGVERGERNVSALNLVRIALALEAEVGQLFPPSSALGVLAGNEPADANGLP